MSFSIRPSHAFLNKNAVPTASHHKPKIDANPDAKKRKRRKKSIKPDKPGKPLHKNIGISIHHIPSAQDNFY